MIAVSVFSWSEIRPTPIESGSAQRSQSGHVVALAAKGDDREKFNRTRALVVALERLVEPGRRALVPSGPVVDEPSVDLVADAAEEEGVVTFIM